MPEACRNNHNDGEATRRRAGLVRHFTKAGGAHSAQLRPVAELLPSHQCRGAGSSTGSWEEPEERDDQTTKCCPQVPNGGGQYDRRVGLADTGRAAVLALLPTHLASGQSEQASPEAGCDDEGCSRRGQRGG